MTQADLGRRLGVTLQAVQALEASEQADRAQLKTLRRAAEAMNCTLVYALVPRTTLEETVAEQASRVVLAEVAAVDRTMALEAQRAPVPAEVVRETADRLVASNRLWRA